MGIATQVDKNKDEVLATVVRETFYDLLDATKGQPQRSLYRAIRHATDTAILLTVMADVKENQDKARKILGLSLKTLRRKLAYYFHDRYFPVLTRRYRLQQNMRNKRAA